MSANRIEYSEKYADDMNEYRCVLFKGTVLRLFRMLQIIVHRPSLSHHRFRSPFSFLSPPPSFFLPVFVQTRHFAQGDGQDAPQKPFVDRSGMARHWRPAKPWLATLRHSSVRMFVCLFCAGREECVEFFSFLSLAFPNRS